MVRVFALNHDLHLHSTLSRCCHDEAMTPSFLAGYAQRSGYDVLCLTNHLWDRSVPGATPWYATQDIEHLQTALPLPKPEGVRFCFGCEVEFFGKGRLSLLPEHFACFDFVAVSINHMYKPSVARPPEVETAPDMAELFTSRAEAFLELPIPMFKCGLAHLNTQHLYPDTCSADVLRLCDVSRWRRIFARIAQAGIGVELNATAFVCAGDRMEDHLSFFTLAKEEGCRFYCASDAHTVQALSLAPLASVVQALGLTREQRYWIP